MPKIVEAPKPERVVCEACKAVMEYLPEEVDVRNGTDYGGGPSGYKRVKCPRVRCPGYGYIDRW